jgi:glycosyltransferase involved in cell wall biosynthesis/4-amino-4-deoxy-L-arabinose transferase-like glycosyltransferase
MARGFAVAVIAALAGAALRLALHLASGVAPEVFEYEAIADQLLSGEGFRIWHFGTWYRTFGSPPFSYLCAFVYLLTGHSPLAMVIVQAAMSSVLTLGAYALGRWCFSPGIGAAASILVSLHPGLLYYDSHKIHPLSFDAALALAGMLAVFRLRRAATGRMALLAGVLHGLACFERTTFAALAPLGVWAVWRGADRPRRLRLLACYLLAGAAVLAPWTLRNWWLFHQPVLVTTTGAEVFWRGNNPLASGGAFAAGAPGVPVFHAAPQAFREQVLGRDEWTQSRAFWREALRFLREHPADAARLYWTKLSGFWWFPAHAGALYPGAYLAMYRWYYAAMLAFALLALRAGPWRWGPVSRGERRVLIGFVASVPVLQAACYVEVRHRWGIEPFLLVLSAAGMAACARGVKARVGRAGDRDARAPATVVRVLTRLNIGGPSVHAALLSTRLDAARFRTCLVVGRPDPDEGDLTGQAEGAARLVRLPHLRRAIHPWRDLRAFASLVRLLWRERPRIVHTHMAKAGALGRLAGFLYNAVGPGRRRGARAALIHTFHGHVLEGYFPAWASQAFVIIERILAARTDVLIAVSPAIRDDLLRRGIGRPAQWRVIPLGLDLTALGRLPVPHGARPMRCGLVGRLVPIKHPSLFLRALDGLCRQDGANPVSGLIVGDGPLRQSLEQETRRLGLERIVRFAGWERDLASIYGQLEVACLTSWNEGTPVALIEAMAAGRAVVATDVGGVRDLLAENGGGQGMAEPAPGSFRIAARGVLVRPGDAEGFSAALARLASDAELRHALGAAGRAYVLRAFDADRLVREITQLYDEALAPRTGS